MDDMLLGSGVLNMATNILAGAGAGNREPEQEAESGLHPVQHGGTTQLQQKHDLEQQPHQHAEPRVD
jgi:hypothetical protein